MIRMQQYRNHQATNQQGMTLRLIQDRINDEIMKSKQRELKKNTREIKLKSEKEDWRLNAYGREVTLEMLRSARDAPRPCNKLWLQP